MTSWAGPSHNYSQNLWKKSGVIQEEIAHFKDQSLDYALHDCIVVLWYYYTSGDPMSAILYCILKERLRKSSIVRPICANTSTMCDLKALIIPLLLKDILSWVPIHEVGIAVIWAMIKILAAHSLAWIIASVTWGIIPGWEDIICSTEFMVPGLLS